MATRPSKSASDIVQDARALHKTASKVLPAIVKADKARGKTRGTGLASLTLLAKLLDEYGAASREQQGKKTTLRKATGDEAAAREKLAEALISIREDVKDAFPDDVELQRAFGRSRRLGAKLTGPLLEAAEAVSGAFAEHAASVKPAGVSQKRIAEVDKLQKALAAADAAQRGHYGARLGATASKAKLLAGIKKAAAQLRRKLATAKVAGAGKSAVKSMTARRKGKKRAAKKA
jgi:hypothetical protein